MKKEKMRLGATALWFLFGPVLGCMWLAAVNYSNNLVYAILYLVAALTFISAFHARRNLASVVVEHVRIHPAFAGEDVRVDVYLRNSSKHTIYGIFFARQRDEAGVDPRQTALRLKAGGGVRIEPGDSCLAELSFPSDRMVPQWRRQRWSIAARLLVHVPWRRGLYSIEKLIMRSSYPFGLIWASVRLPLDMNYYIYPQPKGLNELPVLQPTGDEGSPQSNRPGDDFSGVRAYMPGESLRHVDWKAFARGRPLSIKQFTGGSGHELHLDAAEMSRIPLEARLSQLALWVIEAEKAEIPYSLKLGRTALPVGLGENHSRRALETLAVAGAGSS